MKAEVGSRSKEVVLRKTEYLIVHLPLSPSPLNLLSVAWQKSRLNETIN